MRDWVVGGGIIETDAGVLMVHNRRRNGSTDWSTPGGVIDEGETVLGGLTREVEEETGLRVTDWAGPVYEIVAHAVDMEWRLRVEVHRALGFSGEIEIDDPDGIVFESRWVPRGEIENLLMGQQRWVVEPLVAFLAAGGPASPGTETQDHNDADAAPVAYRYEIRGSNRYDLAVERL